MRRVTMIIIISSGLLFADDFFPVGAYAVEDIAYLSWAHDSLRLNTVLSGWQDSESEYGTYLDTAYYEALKVVLQQPLVGDDGTRLSWYHNMWHALWESEGTMFLHDDTIVGQAVEDSFASNDIAWACSLGVDSAGTMQTGTWNWQLKIPVYPWPDSDSVEYTAIFQLKRDTTSQHDTIPVCILVVYSPPGNADTVFREIILTVSDFQQPNVYQPCTLTFKMYKETNNLVWYKIYWYANVTLWTDYVEIKDEDIDILTVGDYDDSLRNIVQTYRNYPALFRYYLQDEPRIGHFHSNAYLMRYFLETPAIQTLGGIDSAFFAFYADSVIPNELWFDYYPFFGEGYYDGRTPEESGSLFRERLDILCTKLGDMRVVALEETLDFWYAPQAFGKYDSVTATNADEGGNEGRWRLPTKRELRCNTWLSLAHGAKGIMYFLYTTRITHEADTAEWMRGLWRHDSTRREPLFSEACSINTTLEKIGPTLVTLESEAVFKSTDSPYPSCFIVEVSSDDTVQIGTFFNTNNDSFFIMVNRLCQSTDNDTVVVKIHKDSLFLTDLYTEEAIPPDSAPSDSSYFSIPLPPGQGKCFQLVPFAQDFKINDNQAYANMVYAALNTKASAYAGVDSMKIWQNYNESSVDSTGWIQYDTSYCWYLRQPDTNTIYIKYKIDGSIKSPTYSDAILFDSIAPTGSFVINNDSTFTNTSSDTLMISMKDSSSSMSDTSGMSKMRFGNKYLKNLVRNSAFDSSGNWEYDNAIYLDTLKLFKIPLQTIGNYFYQAIAPESLADFVNDTLLLWIDLVSDSFVGDARVEFQYIYGADTAIRGTHPYGDSITIPEGTNAKVSHYNLYSYFKYYPDPQGGEPFIEVRVGVFADSASRNSGKLFIDNLRLDVVSPADSYTRFEDYDTLNKEWTLISGNGVRKVYGQFSDNAGNETAVSFDSIIVDTTKPARRISYPQNGQIISNTITIMGWAHDSLDDPPHFKQYELQHKHQLSQNWYGNEPDSISDTPKYPIGVGQGQKPVALGDWNTFQVNDGWYSLKLTVDDLAGNSNDTTVSINVNNFGDGEGGFSGFSNYLYGLAAGNDVYIGEFNTGKIYQYNTNYELIDTFKLVDSVGTGFPLAMAIDDSGKLWVANSNSHLISKFTSQGSLLLQFAGGFSLPSGFAFDNSGNIWISDRLHHKIKKFNQDGDSLFAFGTQGSEPGDIDKPIGIAFFDNKIYIADSKNKRVSVFDTSGTFIEVIADSAGLQMPFGLVIDSSGCIFVSDFRGNQVIEFDPYGNQLFKIDSILDSPTSLALSPDMNVLYVSDTRNKRVLAFQVRGEPPDSGGGPQAYGDSYFDRLMFDVYPSLSAKQMNIRLQGFAGRKISLNVYDVTGRLIKTFYDNQMIKANQNIAWDCKDDINRKLANGVYFVRLVTEGFQEVKKVILLK